MRRMKAIEVLVFIGFLCRILRNVGWRTARSAVVFFWIPAGRPMLFPSPHHQTRGDHELRRQQSCETPRKHFCLLWGPGVDQNETRVPDKIAPVKAKLHRKDIESPSRSPSWNAGRAGK